LVFVVAQMKAFLPMIIMFGYNRYGTDWQIEPIRIAYGASQASQHALPITMPAPSVMPDVLD